MGPYTGISSRTAGTARGSRRLKRRSVKAPNVRRNLPMDEFPPARVLEPRHFDRRFTG